MSVPDQERGLLLSLTLWVTGSILGFFVTSFAPMTLQSWWIFVGIRLVWQVLPAPWFGVALARTLGLERRNRMVCILVPTLLNAALAWNPLLDVFLEGGPYHLVGSFESADAERAEIGGTYGSGDSIWVAVQFRDQDGAVVGFESAGYQANRWEEALGVCVESGWDPDTDSIEIHALLHLGAVVEVVCDHDNRR